MQGRFFKQFKGLPVEGLEDIVKVCEGSDFSSVQSETPKFRFELLKEIKEIEV